MYEIRFSESADIDMRAVRTYDCSRLLDAIAAQLTWQPMRITRNKKLLYGLVPPFDPMPPVWEIRVGDYRVYYDVDEMQRKVFIRAIRKKPPHRATEETL
jgi:mRNA-degrading endonuclease RelE of RelBE toxin-antitoxin system